MINFTNKKFKVLSLISLHLSGLMTHTCNPRTRKTEPGQSLQGLKPA